MTNSAQYSVVLLLLLWLAGCASSPPSQTAAERRREQADDAYERGSAALARSQYDTALRYYQASLDRGAAVEDPEQTAISMLNIAAVRHRSGNYSAAHAVLLRVISHEPPFAADYVGRAEARLALIELQQNRIDEAAHHAARAERLCAAAGCVWGLAVQNIMAEIESQRGELDAADARVRSTLAAAGRSADRREEANAWRLLGEIETRRGRVDEARRALLAALAIDGKLEIPERIALDLIALARLESASGDRGAGFHYAARAAGVAEAANLGGVLAEARAILGVAK